MAEPSTRDRRLLKRRAVLASPENSDPTAKKQKTELKRCHGEPPAWASDRFDLCQTIGWFDKYVSGFQEVEKGRLIGLMIEGTPVLRAYMDEEIIITGIDRVKYVLDENLGKLVLKTDQNPKGNDIQLRAMDKTILNRIPIGIIISHKNGLLNQQMRHLYNVMGFFMIVDTWYEKIGEYKGVKVRLQKVDLSKPSWWAAKGAADPILHCDRDFDLEPFTYTCGTCNTVHNRVYRNMDMCLNPTCSDFWKVNGADPPDELEFDPTFLACRVDYDVESCLARAPYQLVPKTLNITPENRRDYQVGDHALDGIVCPQCARCLPRMNIHGWCCDNTDPRFSFIRLPSEQRGDKTSCTWSALFDSDPVKIKEVIQPADSLEKFYKNPRALVNMKNVGRPSDYTSLAPYKLQKYEIFGAGTVTHLISNTTINGRQNGPDYLFNSFQVNDFGLQRCHVFKENATHRTQSGGRLTNQFQANFGFPYENYHTPSSTRFSEAHPDLAFVYSRLEWAMQHVASQADIPYEQPNELSLLGYLKDMKIDFHDDGLVGSTIATLSLGARAVMDFRMKPKYYHGIDWKGRLTENDPVLPGCMNYDIRKALKDKFDEELISEEEYDTERKEILNTTDAAPICLQINLYHGHMVVMNGTDLQKYYEHAVTPDGGLRFAATARRIDEMDVGLRYESHGEVPPSFHDLYDGK